MTTSEWIPTFEEIWNWLKEQVSSHLSKFDNLDKLVDRWLDFYYQEQENREITIISNKEDYRNYLIWQIRIYLSFFGKWYRKPWTYNEEKKKVNEIQARYNELIYEWEFNAHQYRQELRNKEAQNRLQNPEPLWTKWKWIVARSISALTDLFK